MPEQSFSDWFGAELDKKLVGKSPEQAAKFLSLAREHWEYRRAQFYATDGRSEGPHPQFGMPTATDFLLFICEIDKREGEMRAAVHVLEGARP